MIKQTAFQELFTNSKSIVIKKKKTLCKLNKHKDLENVHNSSVKFSLFFGSRFLQDPYVMHPFSLDKCFIVHARV